MLKPWCQQNKLEPERDISAVATETGKPRERLEEHVVTFTHTGVDSFGAIEMKFLGRTLKRRCCIFTCLRTRAVLIEVTQSLDPASRLAAVTRIIARRDYTSTIIGAARDLKASMNEWDKANIENKLAQKKNRSEI